MIVKKKKEKKTRGGGKQERGERGLRRQQSGGIHNSTVRSIFHHWRPTGYQDGAAVAEAYRTRKLGSSR